MNLPKETEAKLIEDMADEIDLTYDSLMDIDVDFVALWEAAAKAALAVAVPVIRDAALDEAAVEIEDATGSEIGRSYAAIIRAMKTEGGE